MAFGAEIFHIDNVIERYGPSLSWNKPAYRNHVYRVFHLCRIIHGELVSEEQTERYAIAAAFHDLAIWTSDTFDYIDPSVELAMEYLNEINRVEWSEEVGLMIEWHHKLTAYKGNKSVEIFRKADWIDVTRGLMSFRVKRMDIVSLYAEFPDNGFHRFLITRGLSWGLRHPLNPLPMFRK